MRTIGIIGGIGPDSTIDYYKRLTSAGHSAIVMVSLDVRKLLSWMEEGDLASVAAYLTQATVRLAAAGADMGFIAANTPHIVFAQVQAASPIPLVSIVDAAGRHAASCGYTRVGLLGTRFTMEADFYPKALAAHGITLSVPDAGDLAFVHDKYVNELLKGKFLPETAVAVRGAAERLAARDGLQAILLAGTELPLLLPGGGREQLPLLDTTEMHVAAILDAAG
ncbi:MAG: amino acid racemase [Acidobacteriota bacterium]|nr:amino acid racemase [Acidobacteriota bacterium]